MTTYDDLANQAENGKLPIIPGTIKRSPQAAADAAETLRAATGATTNEELTTLAIGRPRTGTKRGPSPTIRARVPENLKNRITAISETEHRDESDIVRTATATYVEIREALNQATTTLNKATAILKAAGMPQTDIDTLLK